MGTLDLIEFIGKVEDLKARYGSYKDSDKELIAASATWLPILNGFLQRVYAAGRFWSKDGDLTGDAEIDDYIVNIVKDQGYDYFSAAEFLDLRDEYDRARDNDRNSNTIVQLMNDVMWAFYNMCYRKSDALVNINNSRNPEHRIVWKFENANVVIGPGDLIDRIIHNLDYDRYLAAFVEGDYEVLGKDGSVVRTFGLASSEEDYDLEMMIVTPVKELTEEMKQQFFCIPDFTGTIKVETTYSGKDWDTTDKIVVGGSHEFIIQQKENKQ